MGEQFETKVVDALRSAEELNSPAVEVQWDGAKLLAHVVSTVFESREEAERQALLWDVLVRKLGFDAMDQISFIYADAPSEAEADPL